MKNGVDKIKLIFIRKTTMTKI